MYLAVHFLKGTNGGHEYVFTGSRNVYFNGTEAILYLKKAILVF